MIFGVGNPVVEIISSSTKIELLHANIYPTFSDKRIIENESPITGERQWINLWDHAEFKVTVHLHNDDNPIGLFNTLQAVKDALVYFRPHKWNEERSAELDFIKDEYGLDVAFKCTQFEPYYLDNINHFDCLDMTFKSSKPIQLNGDIIAMLPMKGVI